MNTDRDRAGGPRSSLERVENALARANLSTHTRKSHTLMAQCPAHAERTGSLAVSWVPSSPSGASGMVLLHCHGCGASGRDIAEALGLTLADLYDEPLPPRAPTTTRAGRSVPQRRTGARRGRLGRLPAPIAAPSAHSAPIAEPRHAWAHVETYEYVDADGQLIQEVVRERCTACAEPHKRFTQVFLTAAGRRVRRKPESFVPVLYRLPEVLAAVAARTPVWLCEGEKDVHAAESAGLVATTNTQGGRGFPPQLAQVLAGADVRVVLDRDDAGFDRGVALHRDLGEVGATVRLYLPATVEAKSDLSDHLAAGHSVDKLLSVGVDEVAAWAAAGTAGRRLHSVQACLAETQAHLDARDNPPDGDDVTPAEHRLRARRWAVESELRFETIRDLVDDTRRAAGRAGTEWAGKAVAAVLGTAARAITAAARAHELAGVPVPPALQAPDPHLAAGTPVPRAAHNDANTSGGASRIAPLVTVGPSNGSETAGADGGLAATTAGSDRATGVTVVDWQTRSVGRRVQRDTQNGLGRGIDQPIYRIVNGCIVQLDTAAMKKRGWDDSDDPEQDGLKLILDLDVQIVEMEYLEDADTVDIEAPILLGRQAREQMAALNPPAPPVLAAVTIRYTDPSTGEDMQMRRIPADDYREGLWLESLPGPPRYDSKPSGLAKLRDAIKAVSEQIRTVVRYQWTGWRHDEPTDSWMFVHAGGGITADGPVPVRVNLTGPLRRFDLPDPTRDPVVLREAFLQHSAGMMTRLPGRVAAPLLGHVYRSALGRSPFVCTLVGRKASFKTSLASLAMHHWGELWDRDKPAASMSGNGDTFNAVRIKLNAAKDAMFWADDVAPTKDWAAAQKLLEEFARLVHNAEQRSRSTRDGLSVLDGTPPRTSAIVTSEVMPRPGSGADRLLPIPLESGQIDLAQLIELDQMPARHARAQLMASFLSWLAEDLTARRQQFIHAEAARYAVAIRAGEGTDRQGEALGDYWAGWAAMLAFLTDTGAITDAEADTIRTNVDAYLHEALAATADPDIATTVGARVRELIAHGLRSQLAYVEDVRTGADPPWPLASRLGWRRQFAGVDTVGDPRWRVEPRGLRLGYVMHDPGPRDGDCPQIYAEKEALEQLLKEAASKMTDGLQVDIGTVARVLCDDDILIPELASSGARRYGIKRTIHCESNRTSRFYVLRLGRLFGDDDGGDALFVDPPDQPTGDTGGEAPSPEMSYPVGVLLGDHPDTPTTHPPSSVRTAPAAARNRPPAPAAAAGGGCPALVRAATVPTAGADTDPAPEEPEDMPQDCFAAADGVIAEVEIVDGDLADCLFCREPSVTWFVGRAAHVSCWQASTRDTRAAAVANAAATATAPVLAATAPATTGPAVAKPATAPAGPAPSPAAKRPGTRPSGRAGTARPGAAAAAGRAAFTAPAAVLHTDGIWLPDGTCHDLPEDLRHVGHLAGLVTDLNLGTQVTRFRANPGQIWVTADAATTLGLDTAALGTDPGKLVANLRAATRGTALVDDAIADGWQLGGEGDCLNAWTRVWKGEMRGVWVVIVSGINPDELDNPILADTPTPAVLARRLGLFADALQAPWALSGSTTGINLITDLKFKDRDRLLAPSDPVPPALDATLETDLNWSRPPTTEEAAQRFVHAYDRGGSYAAGIAGLELGIGAPVHHPDGVEFDPKLPGYWLIEVPAAGEWRMPYLLRPRHRTGSLPTKPIWVTTPTMKLAEELDYVLPVLEAYTWPEHGRIFDPWYERIRDARTALDTADPDAQAARDQLKVVYTRTIGMLGSAEYMTGKRGYAPERRHLIVAKARTNILRRIVQIGTTTGRWPVAVIADTVLYTSDQPDPVTAWPGKPETLGRGFGQFKPEASGLLADQLDFLNGDGYRGKRALSGIPNTARTPADGIDARARAAETVTAAAV